MAPYNKTNEKRYDYVAGCLIAFAFRQSIIQGKEDRKAWLSFDVLEEKKEDQTKLMAMYSQKYNAVRADETQMYFQAPDSCPVSICYYTRNGKTQVKNI